MQLKNMHQTLSLCISKVFYSISLFLHNSTRNCNICDTLFCSWSKHCIIDIFQTSWFRCVAIVCLKITRSKKVLLLGSQMLFEQTSLDYLSYIQQRKKQPTSVKTCMMCKKQTRKNIFQKYSEMDKIWDGMNDCLEAAYALQIVTKFRLSKCVIFLLEKLFNFRKAFFEKCGK